MPLTNDVLTGGAVEKDLPSAAVISSAAAIAASSAAVALAPEKAGSSTTSSETVSVFTWSRVDMSRSGATRSRSPSSAGAVCTMRSVPFLHYGRAVGYRGRNVRVDDAEVHRETRGSRS